MATSPNFNWPEPDNTDLVKNGALAIRTAVDAIDTSMTDLLGGTTGQVLTKASGTDMDFTWSAGAAVPESYGFAAGKNKIINGDFGIWQRGTSINITSNTAPYTADRFAVYEVHSAGTCTVSRQSFTAGSAPVAGYESEFFLRIATASGATTFNMGQPIEDVRTFAGQTATVSFWAKATSAVTVQVLLQQSFGSGGSGNVNTTGSNIAISTSWTRYTSTISIPSISGKTIGAGNYINPIINYVSGTVASNTVDFWGVQVEAGSVATAFQTATGTLQGELAACMRYFQVIGGNTADENLGMGMAYSTTNSIIHTTFQVPFRSAPSVTLFSGGAASDFKVYNSAATPLTPTSILGYFGLSIYSMRVIPVLASGLTAGNATIMISSNSNGKLFVSAEL